MKGFSGWCEAVMAQVRFWPDRRAIRRELTGHWEDHRLDLERIGYDPELAAERALSAMGDRELDRAHTSPWNQVWLCVAVTAEDNSFPWSAPAPEFLRECTVTDSGGNSPEGGFTLSTVGRGDGGGWYLYWLTIPLSGDVAWAEVRYDGGDWPFALRVGKGAAS